MPAKLRPMPNPRPLEGSFNCQQQNVGPDPTDHIRFTGVGIRRCRPFVQRMRARCLGYLTSSIPTTASCVACIRPRVLAVAWFSPAQLRISTPARHAYPPMLGRSRSTPVHRTPSPARVCEVGTYPLAAKGYIPRCTAKAVPPATGGPAVSSLHAHRSSPRHA